MTKYDAIVIGAGGVGSSAAMHLAKRGARVLALDRFPPGHDRGSSHGHTRVIRLAYFEHAGYVPLLSRAYELWHELEQARGEVLFRQVGLVQVGPPDGEVIPGVRTSAKEHKLELENLSNADFAKRFPGLAMADNHEAVFERRAGYLQPEACVIAHAEEATRLGAVVQSGEEVRGWRAEGACVTVETDRNHYTADRLVITAGAWAGQLLADLKAPLWVLRKPLYWMEPKNDLYRESNGAPCFMYEVPEGIFYGFPQIDHRGVKVAEHTGGQKIDDPLLVNRGLDETDFGRVASFASRFLPQLGKRLVEHATCLYTMTPDANFIVDRHPEYPQVSFAAGLSGHGFKFTSVLGEVLSELALDGKAKLPIEFLSLARLKPS